MDLRSSFIVTQDDVFHSMSPLESEFHDEIAKKYGLDGENNDLKKQYVKTYMTPLNSDFKLPYKKWYFDIFPGQLIPDWFNSKEIEISCRKKLPLWKKLHTIKDNKEYKLGCGCIGLVESGSPKITIEDYYSYCIIYNNSTPLINIYDSNGYCLIKDDSTPTVNIYSGNCNVFDKSTPKINIYGGKCNTFEKPTPNITIYNGECDVHDISTSVITMNNGWCFVYDNSKPTITMHHGHCYFTDNSTPIITVNGGKYNTFDKSSPKIKDCR